MNSTTSLTASTTLIYETGRKPYTKQARRVQRTFRTLCFCQLSTIDHQLPSVLDDFGFSQNNDFDFTGVGEVFFNGTCAFLGELGGFTVVDSV